MGSLPRNWAFLATCLRFFGDIDTMNLLQLGKTSPNFFRHEFFGGLGSGIYLYLHYPIYISETRNIGPIFQVKFYLFLLKKGCQ